MYPGPLIIWFDIRKINSSSNCNAHIEACSLPTEINVAIRALLPELPDELAHVVVEVDYAPVLAVLGNRPGNREVRSRGVPLAFLDYQLRVDYLGAAVLVVFH